MTIERVGRFIDRKKQENAMVRISFRIRSSVNGTFIKAPDFDELGKKNLWRVVTETHTEAFHRTNDMSLSKIFSGRDFMKLEAL